MDTTKEFMLLETMIKVSAIFQILEKKKLITTEELQEEVNFISQGIIEQYKLLVVQSLKEPK